MRHRPVHSLTAWQRRLIGLALSALLSAQWLALAHGVGHRGASQRAEAMQVAGLAQGLLKALTGHDEKSPVCQLFDQLAQSSPFAAQTPAMALAPVGEALSVRPHGLPASAPAGLYLARAPPVLA